MEQAVTVMDARGGNGSAAAWLDHKSHIEVSISWDRVFVKIPNMETESQCLSAIAELYSLYQEAQPSIPWVVDVSEVESMTLSMAIVLVDIGKRLRECGCFMTCIGRRLDI